MAARDSGSLRRWLPFAPSKWVPSQSLSICRGAGLGKHLAPSCWAEDPNPAAAPPPPRLLEVTQLKC